MCFLKCLYLLTRSSHRSHGKNCSKYFLIVYSQNIKSPSRLFTLVTWRSQFEVRLCTLNWRWQIPRFSHRSHEPVLTYRYLEGVQSNGDRVKAKGSFTLWSRLFRISVTLFLDEFEQFFPNNTYTSPRPIIHKFKVYLLWS